MFYSSSKFSFIHKINHCINLWVLKDGRHKFHTINLYCRAHIEVGFACGSRHTVLWCWQQHVERFCRCRRRQQDRCREFETESAKRKENMKTRTRQWQTNDAEASSQQMRDDRAAVAVVSWAWRFQERLMFWTNYGKSCFLCSGYQRQGGRRLKLTTQLQTMTKFKIYGALSYNLQAFWPDLPEHSLRLTKDILVNAIICVNF